MKSDEQRFRRGSPLPPASMCRELIVQSLYRTIHPPALKQGGGPEPKTPGPTESPCGPDPSGSSSDLGCLEYTHRQTMNGDTACGRDPP